MTDTTQKRKASSKQWWGYNEAFKFDLMYLSSRTKLNTRCKWNPVAGYLLWYNKQNIFHILTAELNYSLLILVGCTGHVALTKYFTFPSLSLSKSIDWLLVRRYEAWNLLGKILRNFKTFSAVESNTKILSFLAFLGQYGKVRLSSVVYRWRWIYVTIKIKIPFFKRHCFVTCCFLVQYRKAQARVIDKRRRLSA